MKHIEASLQDGIVGRTRRVDMADYLNGNWHAATIGQFVGQLVDHADTAVVFKLDSVTPYDGGKQSLHWQVILVSEGQLARNYLDRCESIHKTLRALLDADITI